MTAYTPLSPVAAHAALPLVRRDLLDFEPLLKADIEQLLSFEAHSLYFPVCRPEDEPREPAWLPDEEKLLLPLRQGPAAPLAPLLGVLMLRKPDPQRVEALLPFFPHLVSLWLDKLALIKTARTDISTGLASQAVLLEGVMREVEMLRQAFQPAGSVSDGETLDYHSSLGLIVLRLSGLRAIARGHGYAVGEALLVALAQCLRAHIPSEALAARTGDTEFSVFLPANRRATNELAQELVQELNRVTISAPLTGRVLHVTALAGYTVFPHDLDGSLQRREVAEQANLFLDKARLTAHRAVELGGQSGSLVLGYSRILPEGGRIAQTFPLSRVLVTLGRDVGAREGQRFSVWSVSYPVQGGSSDGPLPPLYKGEVLLVETRENTSLAEVLLVGDPTWPLEPGDILTLLPDDSLLSDSEQALRADPLTGLYKHGDFLSSFAAAREGIPFALALLRVDIPQYGPQGEHVPPDHFMGEVMHLVREHWAGWQAKQETEGLPPATDKAAEKVVEKTDKAGDLLAGRHGLNSVLLFHPHMHAEAAQVFYTQVVEALEKELGCPVAVGVACCPYLSFRAADMLECSRKALEYSLLLAAPHVGVFNSLAINISADKRFSQGDLFGAVEEYRLALLADQDNVLAWNSLGVCLASLGRHAEAWHHFTEAAKRHPDDFTASYNLGTVCVSLGELDNAVEHFEACLALAPQHLFARIRLGQLAEQRKDLTEARKHYEAAREAEPRSALPYRHLARLELKEEQADKARERLHQALLRNPQDAVSLSLMATMYLDGGEDAQLAETLARQSIALRPDRKSAWLELARALEAQGRQRDAEDVRLKALEL